MIIADVMHCAQSVWSIGSARTMTPSDRRGASEQNSWSDDRIHTWSQCKEDHLWQIKLDSNNNVKKSNIIIHTFREKIHTHTSEDPIQQHLSRNFVEEENKEKEIQITMLWSTLTWSFSSVQYVEYNRCSSSHEVTTRETLVRLNHVYHVMRNSGHVAEGRLVWPDVKVLVHLDGGQGRAGQRKTGWSWTVQVKTGR